MDQTKGKVVKTDQGSDEKCKKYMVKRDRQTDRTREADRNKQKQTETERQR